MNKPTRRKKDKGFFDEQYRRRVGQARQCGRVYAWCGRISWRRWSAIRGRF